MAYIGSSPTKVVSRQSANIFTYTATANQTAFTGSDANGNTLACTPSDIMVHMNGLRLEESDYTATTTTVTLGSGAAAGDEVTITAFVTFESADHYTKSAADARYELDGAENRFLGVNGTTVTTSSNAFAVVKQGTASSEYAELQILNDIDQKLILGSIGSTYSSGDWSGSRYVYNTHGDLLIKSAAELELFSGGNTVASHRSMVMDASGHIRTPRNVAFNARGSPSTTYSNSWQKLTYNDNVTQRGGTNYNHTNSRFTAPVTGYYQFNAQFTAASNSDNDGTMTFWVNGAVPAKTGTSSMSNTGPNYDGHVISVAMPLTASDYVEVYRYSSVSTVSRASSWQGNFSGFLVG